MQTHTSVVSSHNEWDPLQEVIVGVADGAVYPAFDQIDLAAGAGLAEQVVIDAQGKALPSEVHEAAKKEVDAFAQLLEENGVIVRRPVSVDWHKQRFDTHRWSWDKGGFNQANPRDMFLVVGNQIIEVPSCRKNRYWEAHAYKRLMVDYSRRGAVWVAAPKPDLGPELFAATMPVRDTSLVVGSHRDVTYPLTEVEPVFEAADLMRCGRDIFYQRSFVTNESGIDWLRNYLGPAYRFHQIRSRCRRPLHLDTTFVPLSPGKAIYNPLFVDELPAVLDTWDVRPAPAPVPNRRRSPLQFGSDWLSINVLSLDEKRVVVEQNQRPLISFLQAWGFEVVPIAFSSFYVLGGGLHCCTLDTRRDGQLDSYF